MSARLQHFDVLVIGGGLAGCAAAISLQRQGFQTGVVERFSQPRWKPGESLPGVSWKLLNDLGISDYLPENLILPVYANEACWETDEVSIHRFVQDPSGHGWRIDRAGLECAAQRAAVQSGSRVIKGQIISRLQYDKGTWTGELNGEMISAGWLIDASGRSRHIARRQGAVVLQNDRQMAIAMCMRSETRRDRDANTFIEAVEEGWFYTALLPDGRRVVVLHTDPDLPAYAGAKTLRGFLCELKKTVHLSVMLDQHEYQNCTLPQAVAAGSSRLNKLYGCGWLAVGDAAVSFDPVSAQGMHTALYTGLRGAQHLGSQLQQDESGLEHYAMRIDDIYQTHLRHRQLSVDLVRRWPDSNYWKRRWSREASNLPLAWAS